MRDVCLKMDSNHGDGASTAILMAYRGMAESTRLMETLQSSMKKSRLLSDASRATLMLETCLM